jgi:hypothetical protein
VVTLLLQAHGALLALRRSHPRARLVTSLPLRVVVGLAGYAQWWLALRQRLGSGKRGR